MESTIPLPRRLLGISFVLLPFPIDETVPLEMPNLSTSPTLQGGLYETVTGSPLLIYLLSITL